MTQSTPLANGIPRSHIEDKITNGSPLPLGFQWQDRDDGGCSLIISVPISTQAGIPSIIAAFPPNMPGPFVPKAIARAKALIDEIFEANMVGIVFNGPARARPSLLLPTGGVVKMAGTA
jgi:hypothetical protein